MTLIQCISYSGHGSCVRMHHRIFRTACLRTLTDPQLLSRANNAAAHTVQLLYRRDARVVPVGDLRQVVALANAIEARCALRALALGALAARETCAANSRFRNTQRLSSPQTRRQQTAVRLRERADRYTEALRNARE